jgi:hypothetical protein
VDGSVTSLSSAAINDENVLLWVSRKWIDIHLSSVLAQPLLKVVVVGWLNTIFFVFYTNDTQQIKEKVKFLTNG